MRETTLRKLSEERDAVTLEPDEVAEVRERIGGVGEVSIETCLVCGAMESTVAMRGVGMERGGGSYCRDAALCQARMVERILGK